MAWIEPKINWNENDYYNYWDLDRVESNTKYLGDRLGIIINKVENNRSFQSMPFDFTLNEIEKNIQKISVIPLEGIVTMKTDWNFEKDETFSYVDAIRLEKNLKLIYEALEKNKINYQYCGTFNCGEEVI